jgi:hypothetical protein
MLEQLRRGGLTIRGQHIPIKRISPIIGGVLHAECDYEQTRKTITSAVIFGPQYGPLTSSQPLEALGEARGTYDALIAAAFTLDDQAHTRHLARRCLFILGHPNSQRHFSKHG